jgi:hypothetical protein
MPTQPEQPRLRELRTIGTITVYEVDGLWIRHHLEPDFNDFGSWPRFRSIPKQEFWIDREGHAGEHDFYLVNLLAERKALLRGADLEAASTVGAEAEERARYESEPPKPSDAVDKVKLQKLRTLPNGVTVWLVNGELVRSWLFVEYTEGGHDLVYDWIPSGEIWIDDDVEPQERALVMTHEIVERDLMSRHHLSYDDAHELALRREDQQYRRKVAPSVSKVATLLRYRGQLYRIR